MYDERWSVTDVYRFYVVKMVVELYGLLDLPSGLHGCGLSIVHSCVIVFYITLFLAFSNNDRPNAAIGVVTPKHKLAMAV
jgi:hypothetical protein